MRQSGRRKQEIVRKAVEQSLNHRTDEQQHPKSDSVGPEHRAVRHSICTGDVPTVRAEVRHGVQLHDFD